MKKNKIAYKYLLLTILLFAMLPIITLAQKKENNLKSVLWKITSKNSSKTSYLLGSNHFFKDSWVKSYPKIDSLIKVTDLYVCENLTSIDSVKNKNPHINLINNKVTSKELFGKKYDLVNNYFKNLTGFSLEEKLDHSDKPLLVVYAIFFNLINELAEKKK